MYENKHILFELDKTRKELADLKSKFESFTETIDILTSDPHILRELEENNREISQGKYLTLEQVEKELKLRKQKSRKKG